MQQMSITWCGTCIVVMLRPRIIAGDPEEQERRLEEAVKHVAFQQKLSSTFYRWMLALSAEGDFFAWNIGHRELLDALLCAREAGVVDFLAYYRVYDSLTAVMPEGDFFRSR